jgi:hypothetical protein
MKLNFSFNSQDNNVNLRINGPLMINPLNGENFFTQNQNLQIFRNNLINENILPFEFQGLKLNQNAQPDIQNKDAKSLELDTFIEGIMKNQEKIDEESYKKMRGMFFNIITSHKGSVILQKTIKKTNKDILSLILDEIIEGVHYLMVDPYANYYCQKFFNNLKTSDRIRFLNHLDPYIFEISKSKIGTYPLQAFIEYMSNVDEKKVVLNSVRHCLLDLCLV